MRIGLLCVALTLWCSCEDASPVESRVGVGMMSPESALRRLLYSIGQYALAARTPSGFSALEKFRRHACERGVCTPVGIEHDDDARVEILIALFLNASGESGELVNVGMDLACSLCEAEKKQCICNSRPCVRADILPDTRDLELDMDWTPRCGELFYPSTGRSVRWGDEVRALRKDATP